MARRAQARKKSPAADSSPPLPPADARAAPGGQAALSSGTLSSGTLWSGTLWSGALAIVCLLYGLAFVAANSRVESVLSRALVPDVIVGEWWGPPGTPRGFLDRLPVFGVAFWILLAAYGAGRAAIDRLRLAGDVSPLERAVFSLACGWNLLSLLALGIGLAGGLAATWSLAAILGLLSLVAVAYLASDAWQNRRPLARLAELRSAVPATHWILAAAALAFAAITLLAAPVPPWDFDVREYHLQVPKEWHQAGRIGFLPHNVYGNMPLGAEMQALLAMGVMPGDEGWYYGALAGKVAFACFTLLVAAGLYAAGRRIISGAAGLLAATVYLAHPWVYHVSTSGLNDGVLAGFVFLAAYAAWLARRGHTSAALAGFLAGAAAATKYPGVVFACVPLAIWVLLPFRPAAQGFWRQLRWPAFALFALGAAAGGGAWYVKNAVLTGNPTYPLLAGSLGGQTRTPERIEQWRRAHQVPRDERGRRYSLLQAGQALRQAALLDGLASPALPPLVGVSLGLIAAACFRRFRPASAASAPASAAQVWIDLAPLAVLWGVIVAIWWLATHRIDRFLLSTLPLAALLAAAAVFASSARAWCTVAGGYIALCLVYCGLLISALPDHRLFVRLDQPALTANPDHAWLNAQVEPGRTVLLVGDAEPFDLRMPVYYNTCFDSCVLCDLMEGRTPAERKAELARRHVAYAYVHWPELARYSRTYGYDRRFSPALIDELVAQGVLVGPVKPEGAEDSPAGGMRRPEIYAVGR